MGARVHLRQPARAALHLWWAPCCPRAPRCPLRVHVLGLALYGPKFLNTFSLPAPRCACGACCPRTPCHPWLADACLAGPSVLPELLHRERGVPSPRCTLTLGLGSGLGTREAPPQGSACAQAARRARRSPLARAQCAAFAAFQLSTFRPKRCSISQLGCVCWRPQGSCSLRQAK